MPNTSSAKLAHSDKDRGQPAWTTFGEITRANLAPESGVQSHGAASVDEQMQLCYVMG